MQTIDRRTFVLGGASALALAGCGGGESSPDGLPPMVTGTGPAATATLGVKFETRPLTHSLLVTDARGVQREVGGLGRAVGKLNFPSDVATYLDRGYVADTGNHRVQVFDSAGNALFTMGEGLLSYPGGVEVRPGGTEVLVSDSRNGRVVTFSPEGQLMRKLGQGAMSAPKGIAVLSNMFLIADPGLRKIVRLTLGGLVGADFGSGWILPWDVATDGTNVYVADAAVKAIAVCSLTGQRIGSIPLENTPSYISYRNGALQVG